MFIAALSTIAETWKKMKCPSIYERIKTIWYTDAMEYYSAVKQMKCCRLQQHRRILRISCSVKYVRQKKARTIHFTYMWDIKLKATNEQTRKTNEQKLMETDIISMVVARRKGG